MKIVCATLVSALLLASACHRDADAGAEVREVSGRPATPPSSSADSTDTALTQTVEIGDERSQSEGGVLTNGAPAPSTAAPAPAPRTVPPAH